MKIAISSYSYNQYITQGKMSQLDTVAKAREMGFDAMDFIDIAGSSFEEMSENAYKIRRDADKHGIEIIAYTIGASLFNGSEEKDSAEVERLKKQLDIAHILGASIMRHDVCSYVGGTGRSRSFDLMLPTIASNAKKVTEYARSLGIKTCSENHGFVAQDSDRLERLFNAVDHDNYGLLVDVGNFICVDENPASAVSRLAPYAIHVHIKDMFYRSEPSSGCSSQTRGMNYFGGAVIGEGDIPVKKCLAILKKAGYNGSFTIEYEGAEDCISGIAKGKKNLECFIDEVGAG